MKRICFLVLLVLLGSRLVVAQTVKLVSDNPTGDSSACQQFSKDSISRFVKFDQYAIGNFDFMVNLSLLQSDFERHFFYLLADKNGLYLANKNDLFTDYALFQTKSSDVASVLNLIYSYYLDTKSANLAFSNEEKSATLKSSPIYKSRLSQRNFNDSPMDVIPCETSVVSCSGNIYSFPAGTTGTAPPSVGGYPHYGCLGSQPAPVWYFMQVDQPGDIIIDMQKTGLGGNDIDFICWGPFNSMTEGCAVGLTGECGPSPKPNCCNNTNIVPGCAIYPSGNIVDCSYSGNANETCHILNAQVGKIYILMITNFSQQPGMITFSQTGGSGLTNCNIVINCSFIAITTNSSACNAGTNTYSLTGNIEFTNPPATGTLTITDNAGAFQTFTAPFSSPTSYLLTGIGCDGAAHSVTASFSADATCTMTTTYNAPGAICPEAGISGGGSICDDGLQEATVSVSFPQGAPPFTFVYAIDGVNQPAIIHNNSTPYLIQTAIPGTYTLTSVSNQVCTGVVSGSASVLLKPVPELSTSLTKNTCSGSDFSIGLTSTTPPASTTYSWSVNAGDCSANITTCPTGTFSTNPITGNLSVTDLNQGTVNYNVTPVSEGCTGTTRIISVMVHPKPNITSPVNPSENLCSGLTTNIILQSGLTGPSLSWFWEVQPGGCSNITTLSCPVSGTTSPIVNTLVLNNPATAGSVVYSITPSYGGCTGDPVLHIVNVKPIPDVQLAAFPPVCLNTPQFVLSGGTPAPGGTYLYNGNPITHFDPAAFGTGIFPITYTYTDMFGCTSSDTKTILVYSLPVITFPPMAAVCINNAPFTLNYATPTGGTYSGPGVTAGSFDPAAAGVGSHTITYSYTDANSCTNTATRDITVNPAPVVSLQPLIPVCISAAPFLLTGGTPAGGTYSGPGVAAGTFNPATAGAGTHTITYIFTDLNGCSNTATTNLVVNPLPVVTLADFPGVCITATAFALTGGTPASGTYSGPGVTAGIFNPATAGVGTHTITYTFTDVNGCTNATTKTIQVYPLPVITFNPMPDVCVDHAQILLTAASPAGGTYSGPGVSAGSFDPAAAGVGTHTITYTYSDANNCTNSATRTIKVNALPVVTMQPFPTVCLSLPAFLLTGGSPSGGTYTGTGVSAGMFDPAIAGAGTHTITYTYSDLNGCVNSTAKSIVVNALPVVTLADFSSVCISAPVFTLNGGTPAGGTYAGAGVNSGSFNPAVAGVGSHPVTYTYTDANGCVNSAVKNIQVNGLPDVDFTGTIAPATVCQDFPTPTRYQVTATLSTTYIWSIPAPYTALGTLIPVPGFPNMIDVNWTGTGAAQLKLDALTSLGCQDSRTKSIMINAKPAVALSACFDLVTTTNAKPFVLRGGTPLGNGGNYYIDGTLVSGLVDPSTLSITTHTVSYTYTNVNGCLATDTKTLTVGPSNAGYLCFNGTFTDPRNSDPATNRYTTASYTANGRTTCWMLKNLNWGTTQPSILPQTDNCTLERYCEPGDNTCANYGSLYQWDELMQYTSTPGWQKGVCPPGWHVPTSQDWQDLIDANQGNGIAAGTMKDLYIPSGFQALLNGISYLNSLWAFTSATTVPGTMFWTSTLSGGKPIARGLNQINPSVSLYESSKANAFPVRCVKD